MYEDRFVHGLCREAGEEEPEDFEDLKLDPSQFPPILDVQPADAVLARQPRYSITIRDEPPVVPSGERF